MKKRILSLTVALIMAIAVFPAFGVTVQAAVGWQEAYAEVLRDYTNADFALHDINRDGIPELFVRWDRSEPFVSFNLYTFANGSLLDLGRLNGNGPMPYYWNRDIAIPLDNNISGVFISAYATPIYYSLSGVFRTDIAAYQMSLLTLLNGSYHTQGLFHGQNYPPWHAGSYVGVIENNVVVRFYHNMPDGVDDGYYTAREALLSILQNTRLLEFHTITPANISDHILGGAANANLHPFATALREQMERFNVYRASLIDLNNDGTYEMIIITELVTADGGVAYGGTLFYMHNGELRSGNFAPMSGMIVATNISACGNFITRSADGMWGGIATNVYSLVNGELVKVAELVGHIDADWPHPDGPRPPENVIFYYNDRQATEAEYSEARRRYFGENQDYWESLPDQTAQILAMSADTPYTPAAIAPATPAAAQPNQIGVTIDGRPVNFPNQTPALVDGRTLVPVRGVFEALGFDVSWNEQARQVTLSRANDTIVITIDSASFTANGASHTLDVPAQIIGGSTMLPIRAVLESVGYNLGWEETTRTVIITTN